MKTIEEAAKEFSNKICLNNDVHKSIFEAGFRICAKEFAQQWIPVEVELPEKEILSVFSKNCIVKTDNEIEPFSAYYDHESEIWKEYFTDTKVEVTHWRPIELK